MENIKLFLETTTIHGFQYISTTKKYVRILWILVVITGFIGAGMLISQSFDSWADSPEKTTIRTLPIQEVRFPKVTVCPPKNTFTNLNYDLMKAPDIQIEKDIWDDDYHDELINNFGKHFQQKCYEKALYDINLFKENNKYKNWYSGVSKLPIAFMKDHVVIEYETIETYAKSGEISTPHFGEQFDMDNFELEALYKITITILNYANLTLQFSYDLEGQFESIKYQSISHDISNEMFDSNETEYEINEVTQYSGKTLHILFNRNFHTDSYADWVNKRPTGFRVKWNNPYDYEHELDMFQKDYNDIFIIFVNLIRNSTLTNEEIMDIVRQKKLKRIESLTGTDGRYGTDGSWLDWSDLLREIFLDVVKSFDPSIKSLARADQNVYDNGVTDDTLKTAVEMFVYLIAPYEKDSYWIYWWSEYRTWLEDISLRRLIGRNQFKASFMKTPADFVTVGYCDLMS